MATTIKLKNGSGAPLAGDLVQGEPALDLTNKRLYTEDSGGTVIEVGTNPSTLTVDTDVLVVDAANNRVGVGTASPSVPLEVNGVARVNSYLSMNNNGYIRGDASGELRFQGGSTATTFYDSTNITERMRIDASGKVGIGTPSPAFGLSVESDNGSGYAALFRASSSDPALTIQTTSSITQIQGLNSALSATNDIAMQLSGGNVGIGTASPANNSLTIEKTGTARLRLTEAGVRSWDIEATSGSWRVNNASNSIEAMRINLNGNVGIGTASPASPLHVKVATNANFEVENSSGTLRLSSLNDARSANSAMQFASSAFSFVTGNVGIGTTSPGARLDLVGPSSTPVVLEINSANSNCDVTMQSASTSSVTRLRNGTNDFQVHTNGTERMRIDSSGRININHQTSGTAGTGSFIVGANSFYIQASENSSSSTRVPIVFSAIGGTNESMRIDSSGNLLVGKTSTTLNTSGAYIAPSGVIVATRDSNEVLALNRTNSDGSIASFYKDGTTVGSIGSYFSGIYIATTDGTDSGLGFRSTQVVPCTTTGASRDDAIDLGASGSRFDDIYATNGTIQTSDVNEKQDIEDLSEAETRVAVAAKGLLRKFRWKSAVEEKGDDARVHFGIIAQDLQAAFEAEGLDAGEYGMFIHSTWTDEETGEERSRMGVRYSELLAFIIAAI